MNMISLQSRGILPQEKPQSEQQFSSSRGAQVILPDLRNRCDFPGFQVVIGITVVQ
jgi:hypothetical protein